MRCAVEGETARTPDLEKGFLPLQQIDRSLQELRQPEGELAKVHHPAGGVRHHSDNFSTQRGGGLCDENLL